MVGVGDLASSLVSFQMTALQYKTIAAAARITDEPGATRVLTEALVETGREAERGAARVVAAGLVAAGLGSTLGGALDVRL